MGLCEHAAIVDRRAVGTFHPVVIDDIPSRYRIRALWRMPFGLTPYRKNEVGSVRYGGHRHPPRGGIRSKKGRYTVNTFPMLRVAFSAAAAIALFMIVHSALQAFSTAANVLAVR